MCVTSQISFDHVFVSALESMDEHSNIYPDTNNCKTTSTIQMLLDNLGKMSKLYLINQSAAANAVQATQHE